MNNVALIVAGGSGLRMGTTVPKQFLLLKSKPVLMHTIERFHSTGIFDPIIVVLPKSEIQNWEKLKTEYSFTIAHKVVAGGNTRFESVKNGLNEIREDDGHIAIHDGVRPLVSIDLIKQCMNELKNNSNAIPAIQLFDTLRSVANGSNHVIDRTSLRAIQTPQCFHLNLLKIAYLGPDENSTDDASVFERSGNMIHLVEGERSNLKITIAEDLIVAEALMNQQNF